jgi:hypothetical protein
MWGSAASELVIKWEDGTTGIRHGVFKDFELLYRQLEVLRRQMKLPSRLN